MAELNKYELLLTSGIWNPMSTKQEQINLPTTFVEKLKDKNHNISKTVKKTLNKYKGKWNKTHPGNRSDKNKSMGKMYRQMYP